MTIYLWDTQQNTISHRPITCSSHTTQTVNRYHQVHFYRRFLHILKANVQRFQILIRSDSNYFFHLNSPLWKTHNAKEKTEVTGLTFNFKTISTKQELLQAHWQTNTSMPTPSLWYMNSAVWTWVDNPVSSVLVYFRSIAHLLQQRAFGQTCNKVTCFGVNVEKLHRILHASFRFKMLRKLNSFFILYIYIFAQDSSVIAPANIHTLSKTTAITFPFK